MEESKDLKSDVPPVYQVGSQGPPAYASQPGIVVVPQGPAQPQPPDYLFLSVFTILCCFWPLGLVGLLKSMETRTHYQSGRFAQAETSSREARFYNKIGIAIGIFIQIVTWVIVILIIVASAVSQVVAATANEEDKQ